MAKISSSEVEEEETVEEVEEATPEALEEKKEEKKEEKVPKIWPKKRRGKSSRIISGVTKEDFMDFARKFYPDLTKKFKAKTIRFEELKTKIERDSGLIWVDLKE